MKKLNWFDKFLFFLNSLFAAALLFAYLLPFIPPQSFALLSVLSLAVPLFMMINMAFLIYWVLKLKKQVLLPLIVLLVGFNHLTSIYEFSSSEEVADNSRNLKVLSYNARQFNQYGWSERTDIPEKITDFLLKENPDVLAMQEYFSKELGVGDNFPHKYVKLKEKNAEFGLAILSKHPIVNSGSLEFPTSSNNNAIFADVLVQQDTVRFINVHLQSYNIKPQLDKLEQEHSKRVFKGMGQTFVRQQEQMEIVLDLIERTPYKTVVLGDFNNTAYSYVYRELRAAGFNDAYKEEGNGFGRTFDFDYFPLRIDYIMPEESIEVIAFETKEVHFSDHFPVIATLRF